MRNCKNNHFGDSAQFTSETILQITTIMYSWDSLKNVGQQNVFCKMRTPPGTVQHPLVNLSLVKHVNPIQHTTTIFMGWQYSLRIYVFMSTSFNGTSLEAVFAYSHNHEFIAI